MTTNEFFDFSDRDQRHAALSAAPVLRPGDTVWGQIRIRRAPDDDTNWARMTVVHGADGLVAIPQDSADRPPLTGDRKKRAEDAHLAAQGAAWFLVVSAHISGPVATTQDGAYWSWVQLVREQGAEHLANAGNPAMYAATTQDAALAADVSEAQGTGPTGGRFWRLHSVSMR